MSQWYWKNGEPAKVNDTVIGTSEWRDAMGEMGKKLDDPLYKRVDITKLWWGGTVSTVWLGLDHNFMGKKPLIFESMLFSKWSFKEDMDRYSTLHEAVIGHKEMVRKFSNPINLIRLKYF